jgi:capsular exopolysaccharide synthesis family protein
MATAPQTLSAVIEDLGLDTTPTALATHVTAPASQTPTTVTSVAGAADSGTAIAIANAVAAELIAASSGGGGSDGLRSLAARYEDGMRREIATTLAELTALQEVSTRTPADEARLADLRSTLATQITSLTALTDAVPNGVLTQLTVLSEATEPAAQVAPRTLYYTVLAAVLGLMVAAGIVLLLEYMSDRIRDQDDVEAATGLATLGAVNPRPSRWSRHREPLPTVAHPRSADAEAYRSLRTRISLGAAGLEGVDGHPRALLVTSSTYTSDKAIAAANIAVAFAQAGRSVALIEGDLRHPEVVHLLQLRPGPGLSAIMGDSPVGPLELISPTRVGNLWVLQAGTAPADPSALLTSAAMRGLVAQLKSHFDMIIFNAPSLDRADDAIVLAGLCDSSILVVDMDRGDRDALLDAQSALLAASARLLGTVLVGGPSSRDAAHPYHRPEPSGANEAAFRSTEHADSA